MCVQLACNVENESRDNRHKEEEMKVSVPSFPFGLVSPNRSEQDFDLGVGVSELVVARSDQDTSTGGYEYTVIFLEETDVVPTMLVRKCSASMFPLRYTDEISTQREHYCGIPRFLAFPLLS